ncbi:cyclase family protein [Clostridium sp. AL.422]|uniref:cyclase family protein n=1 Tax=Clostridium TaxID=1485 RepID=UPI00293DF9F8|nr:MULTISPECIES: cyclase family protein [unclassified Clostridium]MDV4152602.1 cyclase family protein [Clostridium sp. AL.422]
MKVIDLSHTINSNMSTYTKDERFESYDIASIEKDGYNEKLLRLCTHTGTHIDAPSHMINKGKTIDEFNINDFIGIAVILDVSNLKIIDIEDLIIFSDKISNCDFVILKTGWDKHWGSSSYLQGYPTLTEEAARWLCSFNIRGIGTDTISIDSFDSIDFEVHNTILSRGMLIIENMANLDKVVDEEITLVATPLKIENGDASPVRAIAITN